MAARASRRSLRHRPAGLSAASVPALSRDEGAPDTPLDLEEPDWMLILKRTGKEIKADRVTLAGAGMTYYFFLAIFPALIAVVGIMGLADADTSGLTRSIERTPPGDSGAAMTEASGKQTSHQKQPPRQPHEDDYQS